MAQLSVAASADGNIDQAMRALWDEDLDMVQRFGTVSEAAMVDKCLMAYQVLYHDFLKCLATCESYGNPSDLSSQPHVSLSASFM